MQNGKVSVSILKRSVINLLGLGPRIGVDCADMPSEGSRVLSATAVGAADGDIMAELAVYKAANNIWAAGGALLGIEAAFLLGSRVEERELKALTRRVKAACERCGSCLVGGHTEVSGKVDGICVAVTAIGGSDRVFSVKNIKPGDDIVITKWAGLEETAIILSDGGLCKALEDRFSPGYFEMIRDCAEWLTVRDEAAIAADFGVSAMPDLSDGGIYGALWDFAEGAGHGFEIDLGLIPFRQETVEISTFFGLDAYRMKSSGSLMAVCRDGGGLAARLREAGIPACVVGHFTDNNDKIIRNEDEISYLGRK